MPPSTAWSSCGGSGWWTGSDPTSTRQRPYHYVLGPLGAALLAAHADQDPAALGYRRDRTRALQPGDAMPEEPRYPDICVQLSGEDGNAFAILGRTTRALRQAGLAQDEIDR